MDTKQDIINFLQFNKEYIMSHYNLNKIAVFGSFARDEQTKNSDVDILIELNDNVNNIYELKNELRDYLSSSFGRSVDLAREKYLKSYAKKFILKDAIYV